MQKSRLCANTTEGGKFEFNHFAFCVFMAKVYTFFMRWCDVIWIKYCWIEGFVWFLDSNVYRFGMHWLIFMINLVVCYWKTSNAYCICVMWFCTMVWYLERSRFVFNFLILWWRINIFYGINFAAKNRQANNLLQFLCAK